MTKKVELLIERFDEGVTLRWKDEDGNTTPVKKLSVNGENAEDLGNILWADIDDIFHSTTYEKIRMSIAYDILIN